MRLCLCRIPLINTRARLYKWLRYETGRGAGRPHADHRASYLQCRLCRRIVHVPLGTSAVSHVPEGDYGLAPAQAVEAHAVRLELERLIANEDAERDRAGGAPIHLRRWA